MPIDMRVGKLRGNTSADAMPIGPFRTYNQPVNVGSLEERFDAGADVTLEALKAAGPHREALGRREGPRRGRADEEALRHRALVLEVAQSRRSRPPAARSRGCASRSSARRRSTRLPHPRPRVSDEPEVVEDERPGRATEPEAVEDEAE